MVLLKTMGAGAVALAALCCGSAQAATVTGTVTAVQGSCGGAITTGLSATGGSVQCATDSSRLNAAAIDVLGNIADVTYAQYASIFSLGVNGYLLLQFSGTGIAGINATTAITERTDSRTGYFEYLDVYAGNTADIATLLTNQVVNDMSNQGTGTESFNLGGPGTYSYLLLVDDSPLVPGRDGFDIAALQVTWVEDNPDVPLPAAGLMLGSAVLGFGALRRRKQKAA